MKDGLYAKFHTTRGEIIVELEYQKVPGTVGNFVGLAEGNLENKAFPQGHPYYDGLKFHRVIPNFMVQGGDPQGIGVGGPGYQFEDEFHPSLKHDTAGKLSMANAGPGTNGSQFFITHVETSWLDGKHSVFGSVVTGQEVVDAIEQGDEIRKLEIIRKGPEAENFNAVEAFRQFTGAKAEREAEARKRQEELMGELAQGFQTTDSGLRYKIEKKGDGARAEKGKAVAVHYKGMLADGSVFDSSYKRNQPLEFTLGTGKVIPGWDEGIQLLHVGDQARFVIPSHLAYGERGAGGVIPPNTTLVFDVELVAVH